MSVRHTAFFIGESGPTIITVGTATVAVAGISATLDQQAIISVVTATVAVDGIGMTIVETPFLKHAFFLHF